MPTLLEQLPKAARLFQFRARPGQRIAGAIDPGIMVIAANHPLIGKSRAGNCRDHIVERLAVPIEADGEMRFGLARTHMIGERERAAPVFRNGFPVE